MTDNEWREFQNQFLAGKAQITVTTHNADGRLVSGFMIAMSEVMQDDSDDTTMFLGELVRQAYDAAMAHREDPAT